MCLSSLLWLNRLRWVLFIYSLKHLMFYAYLYYENRWTLSSKLQTLLLYQQISKLIVICPPWFLGPRKQDLEMNHEPWVWRKWFVIMFLLMHQINVFVQYIRVYSRNMWPISFKFGTHFNDIALFTTAWTRSFNAPPPHFFPFTYARPHFDCQDYVVNFSLVFALVWLTRHTSGCSLICKTFDSIAFLMSCNILKDMLVKT